MATPSPASYPTPQPRPSSSIYQPTPPIPSDPAQKYVSESAFEYLLSEAVDAFHGDISAISAQLDANGLSTSVSVDGLTDSEGLATLQRGNLVSSSNSRLLKSAALIRSTEDLKDLSESEQELAYYKLESMGYRVGMALIERCAAS